MMGAVRRRILAHLVDAFARAAILIIVVAAVGAAVVLLLWLQHSARF
jgi:uncharacterized membrane protein YeaQ/YmgE (transglycosylase-associated protein family)